MEGKCEKCGGTLIEGSLMGMHGLFFYPEGQEMKFNPKRSPIVCSCCKKCGIIQNIRVSRPEQL